MTFAATAVDSPAAQDKPRFTWVELSCLNCGELAGYIENQRLVKPVVPGRIRMDAGRPRCGRCSGLLLTGERGVANSVQGIG
jgi:hypothetical protein